MKQNPRKVLFLCIPGTDIRRITPAATPYLHGLLQSFPTAKIVGYGSVEVLSSTLTGQRPNEHGIWQCRLKPAQPRSFVQCCVDLLPDRLTTAVQGIARRAGFFGEMATIPPRRRRRFEFYRMKFFGRANTAKLLATLNALGVRDSLLTAAGLDRSRYRFTDQFSDRDWLLQQIPKIDRPLEIFQLQGLDLLEHWFLETPAEFEASYAALDRFIRQAHEACQAAGVTLVLLSAHGHEPVQRHIDLKRELSTLALAPASYTYYIESMKARFWFHTQNARETLSQWLTRSSHGTALSYTDLARYNIPFADDAYGELYFVAHPGSVFFPDDFYHPLVNLYFALTNSQKRRRLRHPRLRGQHGYIPTESCERGFMSILDAQLKFAAPEMELRDAAPTVLTLMGEPVSRAMSGTSNLA